MTSLSRSAQAKLAAEIQAAAPTPEWDSIDTLKKWRERIKQKDGKERAMTFGEMVALDLDLKAEQEHRQRVRDEIKVALEAAMLLADVDKVVCEGYPVNYVTRKGSRKIVAEKLLENGVPASVIAASTEIGPESHYVQIGKKKD